MWGRWNTQSNKRLAAGHLEEAAQFKYNSPSSFHGFRRYPSYAFVLILEGRGTYQDEKFAAIELKKGSLIKILPHIPHRYSPAPGTFWEQIYLRFKGRVFDELVECGIFNIKQPVLHLPSTFHWQQRMKRVLSTNQTPTLETDFQELALLQQLTIDLLKLEQNHSPSESQWREKVDFLLRSQLNSSLKPQAFARKLGEEYESFRKKFFREFKAAPLEYQIRLRIEQVAAEIQGSSLSIEKIAQKFGFNDPYYFSRLFKKKTGKSPRIYRQESRGE